MQAPINDSASCVLSGSGAGTVTYGPQVPGVIFDLTNVATITTSTVNVPTFLTYQGPVSQGNFLGGTYDGNNDSCEIAVTLYNGQVLTGTWTGGDPGAVATMSVFGTKYSPGG